MQNLARVIQSKKPLHMCSLGCHFSRMLRRKEDWAIYIQTGVNFLMSATCTGAINPPLTLCIREFPKMTPPCEHWRLSV